MAICPACGRPVTVEGGFVVTQEQSATCTCKVAAKIASAPVPAPMPVPQRRSMKKEEGLLARVVTLGTMKLENGTLAIIFALGTMAAICALSFAENRWGRSPGTVLVFFLASLVLTITVCFGLWTAVRGLDHTLQRERVLATIGMVMLAVALLYSGLATLVSALAVLWQSSGGHGWTPFM